MGSTIYYGRRVTTTDSDYADVGANSQRFYVPNALGQNMIAYRMEFLGGKYPGQGVPNIRLGIAASPGGGTPGALLAYTGVINPSNFATSGNDAQVSGSDLVTPILMTPAQYGLGIASQTNMAAVIMRQAALLPAGFANGNFYTKYGALNGSIPSDPVGGTPSYEGHMDIWVIGVTNTAPSAPNFRAPVGFLNSADTTPLFEGNFIDAEKTLPNGRAYDQLNQVQIQVVRVSDNVVMWDTTYSATTAEKTAHRSSKEYAGTALVAGIDYRWRIRHSDRAGAWGTWSDYQTFQINPGGTVGTPTSPTGKQTVTNPGPFIAPWTHAASLSTNAVEFRLLSNETVIHTSATIAKTVAHGASISISNAETGVGLLSFGAAYAYQIRGRDTGGAWSPWSPAASITINSVPTVPTNRSPGGGQAISSYPLLTAKTSDADDATNTLGMTFEIKRADTTTVSRAGTYNATLDRFEYQTTATDLPSYQTFTWRARSADPAGLTSSWSAYETLIYGAGPTVTLTSPTDGATITTSTPVIAWTATGQVSRRVRVYRATDGYPVHDSLTATTAVQTYTLPAALLRNGIAYQIIVDVTNSAPLTGSSAPATVTLLYPTPTAVPNFQAFPVSVGLDEVPSAIRLEWGMTDYPASQFEGYDVYRQSLSGVDRDPRLLRRITAPVQTTFTDYHPRSGTEYQYFVRQVVRQGLDVLESDASQANASLQLDGIMLVSALDPTVYRASLRYLAGGNPSHSLRRDGRQTVPLGATKGRTIRSGFRSWEPEGSFMILSDTHATADQRIDELRDAVENAKTFSYRDHRGRKRWVTVTDYEETDVPSGYVVDMAFREEYFIEGEILS